MFLHRLPTDVQAEAIPLILGGGDVLMAAETVSLLPRFLIYKTGDFFELEVSTLKFYPRVPVKLEHFVCLFCKRYGKRYGKNHIIIKFYIIITLIIVVFEGTFARGSQAVLLRPVPRLPLPNGPYPFMTEAHRLP